MNEDTNADAQTGVSETVTVHWRIVTSNKDGFTRRQPAILEGPEDAWLASRQLIDFGCAVLENAGSFTAASDSDRVHDLVLVALLRRALVTAEAIWQLLSKGLEDSATVLLRTLLDIHLNIRLVTADPSKRMASRLGAYHYVRCQRHGEKMLRDPNTRAVMMPTDAVRLQAVEIARSYARHLESPVFDDVRADVKRSMHWHGHPSVEAAFRAAGDSSDYLSSYDAFTSFVHASNVDHDFVESNADGVLIRALVERDPARIQTSLGFMTLPLLEIVGAYVDAKGLPADLSEEAHRAKLEESETLVGADDIVLDDGNGIRQRIIEAFPSKGTADEAEEIS